MLANRLIQFSNRLGIKFIHNTETISNLKLFQRLNLKQNNYLTSHLSRHSICSLNFERNNHEIFNRLDSVMNNWSYFIQKRFRKKNPPKKVTNIEESDSENEDELDLDESNENLEIKEFNTTVISWRLDAIGKTCFNISRAKFEQYFYDVGILFNLIKFF